MLAADYAIVAELNRLARSERVAAGLMAERGLTLSGRSVSGVGDVVVAHHNDRHLRLADGEWVHNRDRFVVTATHQDGAMTVTAPDGGHRLAWRGWRPRLQARPRAAWARSPKPGSTCERSGAAAPVRSARTRSASLSSWAKSSTAKSGHRTGLSADNRAGRWLRPA